MTVKTSAIVTKTTKAVLNSIINRTYQPKITPMLSTLSKQLFTNWHPMRWVALAFGLMLGYNWLVNSAYLSGWLSIFFLFQAITNTGCLAGQCAPKAVTVDDQIEDVEYEEIK